jgi:ParB-like chromosome segregation protein Spo0J
LKVAAVEERDIPLDLIEVDPANVRSIYSPQMIAGLRTALKTEGGFINPPAVYPIGEGRYRVKHGSTRVLAARGAAKTLRVRVVEPPASETSKLLSQMSENLLQGSLGPADVGLTLKRLRNADGRERSLSQLIGALKATGIERTKSWVSIHLTFAELAPAVQQLLNAGRITGELAYQLRGLPDAEQSDWAQRIIDHGLTLAEVRRQLGLDTDEGTGSHHSPEALHYELSDRLAEAAGDLEGRARRRGPGPDADQRPSHAQSRWELLPVPLPSADQRKLHPLNAADWSKTATPVEKQLAQEALFFGGCSAQEAIRLVERAMDEAQGASESMMMTLNGLGRLAQHPAELRPDSALAEFLRLRLQRIQDSLASGPTPTQ